MKKRVWIGISVISVLILLIILFTFFYPAYKNFDELLPFCDPIDEAFLNSTNQRLGITMVSGEVCFNDDEEPTAAAVFHVVPDEIERSYLLEDLAGDLDPEHLYAFKPYPSSYAVIDPEEGAAYLGMTEDFVFLVGGSNQNEVEEITSSILKKRISLNGGTKVSELV